MPIDYASAKQQLYAAVLADILDDLGFRDQVMDASIRPLQANSLIIGRARTMLSVPEYAIPDRPFDLQIDAIDALEPGDVVVAHMSQITACAFWGELFSTAARQRGAAGALMDGYVRDARQIMAMNFPIFSTGIHPANSKGRAIVSAYDVPIRCGGVLVHPGDIVFAEMDGVVVIPERVAAQVIPQAIDLASRENRVRSDLLGGSSLRAAWETHRVM